MLEPGCDPALPDEALSEADVIGERRRDHLEGDEPAERQIVRAIDDPHPAAPGDAADAIPADHVSGDEVASAADAIDAREAVVDPSTLGRALGEQACGAGEEGPGSVRVVACERALPGALEMGGAACRRPLGVLGPELRAKVRGLLEVEGDELIWRLRLRRAGGRAARGGPPDGASASPGRRRRARASS